MSSTVQVGKMELTSNQPAAEMVESLTPREESKDKPKVLVDGGVKVKDSEPPSEASEAARKLGELGGRAAAEARKAKKAEEKEPADKTVDKTVDTQEPETEAKSNEDKDETVDTPADKAPDKPGHPRHDPQARIARLAQQKREAEQRARELEERLARVEEAAGLRQKQPAPQAVRETADDGGPPRPDINDYDLHEEFTEALIEWKADRRIETKLREIRQQQEAESKAWETIKAIETFRERTSKYKQVNPDVAERVAQIALELLPTISLPPRVKPGPANVLADEVMQSKDPGALMAYLADHPEEYQELLEAPDPRTLWRGVAVIESRLSGTPAAPERRPSNAPPPLRPVQPSPAAGSQEITGDIPFEDFVKRRKKG